MNINVNGNIFDLSTPKVMGIVNTTPDSFYAESRVKSVDSVLLSVGKMKKTGAQIVDIGGYSSRPGAKNITINEEISRVLPAIEAIHSVYPDLVISIDTFRSEVAELAIKSGASVINDISGFGIDPKIVSVASKYNTPYILMHMVGNPQNMTKNTNYQNLFSDMVSYFSHKCDLLKKEGVNDVIIDPGFGFSKTIEQNYEILNWLDKLKILNKPILSGLSRKSMIYKKLNCEASDPKCLDETVRLHMECIKKGASIIRVHDVDEHAKSLKGLV